MTSTTPMPVPQVPTIDEQVAAEKARTIQSYVPWMMNGYVLCAWFASWLLFDERRAIAIDLWVGTLTLLAVANVLAGARGKQRIPRPESAPRRLKAVTRASFLFGMLWAVGVLILWPTQRLELQVFLMYLTAGLLSAALLSISVHLPAFYAYFLPGVGSLLIATLWEGSTVSILMAVATLAYLHACTRFVKTLSETFVGLIRSRFEVANLAEDLKQQKEVADKARDAAEEASQSKSRFLAAASHDLRQPVHSLSLFVGALALQPLTTEGARLVSHMQATVESLGSMFNALLNISKLDANTIQPEWAHIDLLRLLERICDTEQAVAHEKGLALRLNAPPLWVRTDPGLLDRVVRNLVANALRYTDHGGVLVAARVRAGQVTVRVWDTGHGIPADKQTAVFDEFVQLHNPERDRNNGLGLGLAIVRRLTDLMGIAVSLTSRVGCGSVFSLALGPALPAASVATPASTTSSHSALPPLGPIQSRLVIVIDDDAGIREGASALLRSWGYEVITVGALAELLPIMATRPQVPHLVICDLRLRQGESGIEAVNYLRTQYNDDFPAILITGDTDPQRLRLATQSGLALLHKPVTPEALKAAMADAFHPARG